MVASEQKKDRQAYATHLNYIECLAKLSSRAVLVYVPKLTNSPLPCVNTKDNLIRLTAKSLKDEHQIVQIDEEYSFASTSWLPVKSYYLIYNLMLTAEYVITAQKASFRMSHADCVNEFTRKLRCGEIQFSEDILNQTFDKNILDHKIKTGSNLSPRTSPSDMYKMIMRKIAVYKVDNWKQHNSIDLRKRADKLRHAKYLSTFTVSIFDFPYLMRIRANYRDFAFIDGISSKETARYFKSYYAFTARLAIELSALKRQVVAMRSKN